MFSPDLLGLVCCPTDQAPLKLASEALRCTLCMEEYPIRDGYVEVFPREAFDRTSKYTQEAGRTILDYREIGLPLLSAKVKNDKLNDFMRFTPTDTVLDLGCGNGKFAFWNRGYVEKLIAIDIAPWFADAARSSLPLFRGDIRALPFVNGTFDGVYSIDVLEHLTADDIARVLDQVHRKLKPGGRFFVFSNTRERQSLAWAMAPQRAASNWLKAHGMIDTRRDEWRKSDHVNAISTFEELRETFADHGFRVKRVAFWNGVFQGWIENVLVKLGEHWLARGEKNGDDVAKQIATRQKVRSEINSKRASRFRFPLVALTAIMSIDLRLFGHMRAGPYFVLTERDS